MAFNLLKVERDPSSSNRWSCCVSRLIRWTWSGAIRF